MVRNFYALSFKRVEFCSLCNYCVMACCMDVGPLPFEVLSFFSFAGVRFCVCNSILLDWIASEMLPALLSDFRLLKAAPFV